VHPPYGPHKIAANGQVVVPKDVLAAAGLGAGDFVYVQALEDPPGAVLIVPADVASRWFEAGRVGEGSKSVL
jgi:bifunctional DNA-binding transcriptional regulator/antitoxin component of YhaV-PrlF toxin-antitoxin module